MLIQGLREIILKNLVPSNLQDANTLNEPISSNVQQESASIEVISSNLLQEIGQNNFISSNPLKEGASINVISSNPLQESASNKVISSNSQEGSALNKVISSDQQKENTSNEVVSFNQPKKNQQKHVGLPGALQVMRTENITASRTSVNNSLKLLQHLANNPQNNTRQLCKATGMSESGLSKRLSALRKQGYVTKLKVRHYVLTQKALDVLGL